MLAQGPRQPTPQLMQNVMWTRNLLADRRVFFAAAAATLGLGYGTPWFQEVVLGSAIGLGVAVLWAAVVYASVENSQMVSAGL